MQTRSYWMIAAMITPGIAFGQQKSNGHVQVLTVCEVLGDVNRYADTAVAVVGRMERSISLIVPAAKLSVVRRTTRLGFHQEPRFKADGQPSTAVTPNEWAAVYGRIVRSPRLDEDCGASGCGGDDVPLIIIAEPSEVHTLRGDGKPLPEDE